MHETFVSEYIQGHVQWAIMDELHGMFRMPLMINISITSQEGLLSPQSRKVCSYVFFVLASPKHLTMPITLIFWVEWEKMCFFGSILNHCHRNRWFSLAFACIAISELFVPMVLEFLCKTRGLAQKYSHLVEVVKIGVSMGNIVRQFHHLADVTPKTVCSWLI